MHSLLSWDYGVVGERLGSPEEMGTFAFLETSAEVLHVHWCLWFHSLQFILLYSHEEKMKIKMKQGVPRANGSVCHLCERFLRFGFIVSI